MAYATECLPSPHLVKTPPRVNRTALNRIVHNLRQRYQEIRRINLRVEENLGAQEPLKPNVHGIRLARDLVPRLVLLDIPITFLLVFFVFLDNIGADVRVLLLDLFGEFEGFVGWDLTFAISEEGLDKGGDVFARNRNVFDGAADDVAFGLWVVERERSHVIAWNDATNSVNAALQPTTGITCVNPSPESITVPVNV